MNLGEARQRAFDNGFRPAAQAAKKPWKLSDKTQPINQVVNGDSVKLLNSLPEGWVDLVFADPPFNIGYLYHGYDDRKNARRLSWNFCRAVAQGRPPGAQAQRQLLPRDRRRFCGRPLCVLARRELGFHLRNWIIWHYTFGQQTKNEIRQEPHAHSYIFPKSQLIRTN